MKKLQILILYRIYETTNCVLFIVKLGFLLVYITYHHEYIFSNYSIVCRRTIGIEKVKTHLQNINLLVQINGNDIINLRGLNQINVI